ncbi:hypothetical protein [Priestia sp. YIM B13489]|uniref:hypothetical protein n=1 Tax=Priestia sp. YIM B13489 TaxID=3366313 RepID=UPI00366E9785
MKKEKSVKLYLSYVRIFTQNYPNKDIIYLITKNKDVFVIEWLDDSKACLDTAAVMIEEVEQLAQQSIKDESAIPYLKVKIKNCLENCRSPLDYVANYIFDTYCRNNYTKKELHKFGKPYFPIRKTDSLFDICIRDNFRNLLNSRSDIVDILKSCQQFKNSTWLQDLTSLINENKHRNLTKQNDETHTTIRDLNFTHGGVEIGGISNITFVTSGHTTPIKYGGGNLDFSGETSYPFVNKMDTDVKRYFFFRDLGRPVTPTLKEILEGTRDVIGKLEKTI